MMIKFPEKFVVTGTDTNVGKTLVSAMLMSALDASYWKPIQAGLDEETDTQYVQRVSEAEDQRIIPEQYRLQTPMSPHGAADIDGYSISLSDFTLPEFSTRHLIIEGAGGLIVPINWKDTILDLIRMFQVPIVLVARSSLGTLNHTLLSVQALKNQDIPIFAIILSGEPHSHNKKTLEHFTGLPVLEMHPVSRFTKEELSRSFHLMMDQY